MNIKTLTPNVEIVCFLALVCCFNVPCRTKLSLSRSNIFRHRSVFSDVSTSFSFTRFPQGLSATYLFDSAVEALQRGENLSAAWRTGAVERRILGLIDGDVSQGPPWRPVLRKKRLASRRRRAGV
jgi:hypothetical protein